VTEVRALAAIGRQLTAGAAVDDVLALVLRHAGELLGGRAILLLSSDDGALTTRAATVSDPSRAPTAIDDDLAARLGDVLDGPGFLAAPVVIAGAVRGLFAVGRAAGTPDDEPDGDHAEWLLSALADQAALALERASLDEGTRLRERLLGIVGHDLRNPLGAIVMAADVVLRDHGVEPEVERLASRVQSSARRMGRILDQLADFTQARRGNALPLVPELCDLGDIGREVLGELRTAYPDATLALVCDAPIVGEWDRARIAQVLTNLASNAVQHGDSERPISVSCGTVGDAVTVTVHNHGAPIPRDLQRVLFDPFQRAAQAGLHGSPSFGLGLYISREIAHAHGGTLAVRSSDDAGTVFALTMPRRAPASPVL
jgi:phosphoserine phosphatase RsbU/P